MKFYRSVTAAVFASILTLSGYLSANAQTQAPKLQLQLLVQELTAPIHLEELPDGSGRMLVVQQDGLVKVLTPDGKVLAEPFLDLRSRMFSLQNDVEERGLLGFALHPQFARNGRFFISYSAPLRDSAPQNWNHTRKISEFTTKLGSVEPVDASTERVLIAQDWPSRKHNGGGLAFGPDGMLFIGMGDSGASHGFGKSVIWEAFNVPAEGLIWDMMAQDKHSLYGKILRIDVDRGYPGYAIPNGNPLNASQGDKQWPLEKVTQIESRIISLAEDRNGEIYLLTHDGMGPFGNTGKVYKLVPQP